MVTSFYPGPSKVYPRIAAYLQDAYQQGILSLNHRSKEFMHICEKTLWLMREKLSIPEGYTILFTSSATESWEIISQSFVLPDSPSLHFYNGAFGRKWMDYTRHLKSAAFEFEYLDPNTLISPKVVTHQDSPALVCLTQNETSNGSQINNDQIQAFREAFPEALLALDVTSSLGGADLPIVLGDIWFGSVQKCLGLPAGLGLLIASPRAAEVAARIGERRHYNSYLFMADNMAKFQTHYTPNVLGIYLLMRVLEAIPPVSKVFTRLSMQAHEWYQFLDSCTLFEAYVKNPDMRSQTVVCIQADEKIVTQVKEQGKEMGLGIGGGYGDLKSTTFRIANFPAIEPEEMARLKAFLLDFHQQYQPLQAAPNLV
jgi:phosphoserine aminotransferase